MKFNAVSGAKGFKRRARQNRMTLIMEETGRWNLHNARETGGSSKDDSDGPDELDSTIAHRLLMNSEYADLAKELHQMKEVGPAFTCIVYWHPRGWIKNTFYTNHQLPRCLWNPVHS